MVRRTGVENLASDVLHLGVVKDWEHLVFIEVDHICGRLLPRHQVNINATLKKEEHVLTFSSNMLLGLFIPLLVLALLGPIAKDAAISACAPPSLNHRPTASTVALLLLGLVPLEPLFLGEVQFPRVLIRLGLRVIYGCQETSRGLLDGQGRYVEQSFHGWRLQVACTCSGRCVYISMTFIGSSRSPRVAS